MTPEDKLSKLFQHGDGLKVPEGYFQDVMIDISAKLPPHPAVAMEESELPESPRRRLWVKVRPIVYMAAMFAGIWCMMKIFTTVQTSSELSVDNPPAVVAEALKNPDNMRAAVSSSACTDMELSYSIEESYDGDFAQFEEDFKELQN